MLVVNGGVIISWLAGDVVNETDDDKAVAEINGSSCTTIQVGAPGR